MRKSSLTLELCADSLESVQLAAQYGFKRVELCAALELGGLTPSPGMVERALSVEGIEIHPIVRPRAGGFFYSNEEVEVIYSDIIQLLEMGCHGVVYGMQNAEGLIDLEVCQWLQEQIKQRGKQSTFHRAFDVIADKEEALEQIIALGFGRILTSGGMATAEQGAETIAELIKQADDRIQIMAGSGVAPSNAAALANLGVDALHFTARKPIELGDDYGFGQEFEPDTGKIEGVIRALNG